MGSIRYAHQIKGTTTSDKILNFDNEFGGHGYGNVASKQSCNYHVSTHPVATSHIFIVLSLDADTMKSPDGIKVMLETL